jgi:hypothetical protein
VIEPCPTWVASSPPSKGALCTRTRQRFEAFQLNIAHME